MDTSIINSTMTLPEKQASVGVKEIVLGTGGIGTDSFSEPSSPVQEKTILDYASSRGHGHNHGYEHRHRHVSHTSRRTSSFMSSHRSKMSSELTLQAESKFFALVEIMASASREASSLKEIWSRLVIERETWSQEREELVEKICEITEELECKERECQRHGHDSGEKKKHIERLMVELSTAMSSLTIERKKVVERDHELERCRHEIHEYKESITRHHKEIENVRTELETIEITLRKCREERDCARADAEKHERELARIIRERTELHSRFTEITEKYESSRRELTHITEKVREYEMEREEHLHEVACLKEECRKAKCKAEEYYKEVTEITEKYERITREVSKFKETIRTIESERDEISHTLEHVRRDLKAMIVLRDEAEDRCSDISLKHEHTKRELVTVKEKVKEVEIERDEHRETIEKIREEKRVLIIERDELREESHAHCKTSEERHREIISLTETLRKTEHTLSVVRTEVHVLQERIESLDRERDEACHKNTHLTTEISELNEKITIFQVQIKALIVERDSCREDLRRKECEYDDLCKEFDGCRDDSGELECEIDRLRTALREAREQKEQAIVARNSADRERDEFIAKYEAKCRELERYEEESGHHHHGGYHGRPIGGGRYSTSRAVSRNGMPSIKDQATEE